MSFKSVFIPSRATYFRGLEAGEVSIAKTGVGLFMVEDLALVSIAGEAALLADNGTLRLGLRAPRLPEDRGSIVRVAPVKRGGKPVRGKVQVSLAPGLRELGLTLLAVSGRYPLSTKGGLLIINVGDPKAAPASGEDAKA